MSLLRKQESRKCLKDWIPAFAGMTMAGGVDSTMLTTRG
jgi:hypothetical protein